MKNLAQLMFMRLQGIRVEAMCLSTGQLQQRGVAASLPSTSPILSPSPAADVGPRLRRGVGHKKGLAQLV